MPTTSDLNKTVNKVLGTKQYTVGGTDGTAIGNNSDRLKVDSAITSVTGTGSISSKLRIVPITSAVTLSTGSYTTCYTYSGSGLLMGFNIEFNNVNVIPRLQIDGETIFDSTTISTYGSLLVTANDANRRQNGTGLVVSSSTLDFSFKVPIKYSSSITISADGNGGVLFSRQFSQGMIYLTKDT